MGISLSIKFIYEMTPRFLPMSLNASKHLSISCVLCTAEICTLMRASPVGREEEEGERKGEGGSGGGGVRESGVNQERGEVRGKIERRREGWREGWINKWRQKGQKEGGRR